MDHPTTRLPRPPSPATALAPQPYEPPRLTGRQALEQVTLFSMAPCVPGSPGCSIGHP